MECLIFIKTKLPFISFSSMLVIKQKERKSAEEILNELKASFNNKNDKCLLNKWKNKKIIFKIVN